MDQKLLGAAKAGNTALVAQILDAKANIDAKDARFVSVQFLGLLGVLFYVQTVFRTHGTGTSGLGWFLFCCCCL